MSIQLGLLAELSATGSNAATLDAKNLALSADSSAAGQQTQRFVNVLIRHEAQALDGKTYTYAMPDGYSDAGSLAPGTLVRVPLGRQALLIPGIVTGVPETPPPLTQAIKPVAEIIDPEPLFDARYLALLRWLSVYYAAPIGQVMTCALPAALLEATTRRLFLLPDATASKQLDATLATLLAALAAEKKGLTAKSIANRLGCSLNQVSERVKPLIVLGLAGWGYTAPPARKKPVLSLTAVFPLPNADTPTKAENHSKKLLKPTQKQVDLHARLAEALQTATAPIPVKLLAKRCQTTEAALKKLAEAGWITLAPCVTQATCADFEAIATYGCTLAESYAGLTLAQQQAVTQINTLPKSQSVLIHGVTGSGKTEVYLQLAAEAMTRGEQVLMLVPEIVLASHLAHRFQKRFGKSAVCIWHSQIAKGEKLRLWRNIQAGETPLVIGARSAVFAPFKQLGLIVLDESHEDSFKQESPAPRYDARQVSRELARLHEARLLFGSATPDVAMYYTHAQCEATDNAAQVSEADAVASERSLPDEPSLTGSFNTPLITIEQRYSAHGLPPVEVIAHKTGPRGILSEGLYQALHETFAEGHQAILLMNRRGFNRMMRCEACQYTLACPACDVNLTVHAAQDDAAARLQCHHCGYQEPRPSFCPECASTRLIPVGSGTQRIEAVLQEQFEGIRLGRLDGDTVRSKTRFGELMQAFDNGQMNALIGTQMVAKGLDNPNVTLVGVLQADLGFWIPDFKSAERGFQLLTQVAGRAGRGQWPGRVIFQVMDDAQPVLAMAQTHDYGSFYAYELEIRRRLVLPPFSQLFRFGFSATHAQTVERFGRGLVSQLKQRADAAGLREQLQILGPAPCMITRVNHRFRMHVLVKNLANAQGHALITQFYQAVTPPAEIQWVLDVDALALT
ncbi:MAG: primosomal protein N' [Vampirovibrionales bacterium]|nr:primosomal protein N' [Vampirovibrionales bacterium]